MLFKFPTRGPAKDPKKVPPTKMHLYTNWDERKPQHSIIGSGTSFKKYVPMDKVIDHLYGGTALIEDYKERNKYSNTK